MRRLHRRRHASWEDAQRAKREASRAWWTPARKRAHAERIATYHREGRYARTRWARRRPRVWTDADRVAQGERTKALWASGRLGTPEHLAILSERQRRAWAAGRHDGQGDRKRREWADGKFAHMSAHMRALWAAGTFDDRSARMKALWRAGRFIGWRGGLRGELLKSFPQHTEWLKALSDDDLAGLLALHEERAGDGQPVSGMLENLFGLAREHDADE